MAKFKVANPHGRYCKQMAAAAEAAFREGDSATGRSLYHRAAKLGCEETVSLGGVGKRKKGRRKKGQKRRTRRR